MWRPSETAIASEASNGFAAKVGVLSGPLGWIAGWRFDRIRSAAERGAAMQLLASAPHITWAVSNFNLYRCCLFCENWQAVLNVSYIAPDGTVDYASNARPSQARSGLRSDLRSDLRSELRKQARSDLRKPT